MADTTHEQTTRLRTLLDQLGPENIWRPVTLPDGTVLAGGHGADIDGLDKDIAALDFAGKRVVDLGCNLGTYTRMAARGEATSALGVDALPGVIDAARLYTDLLGTPGARFEVRDFVADPPREADLALMVDIIGKKTITKGRLYGCLDAMAATGAPELLFTIRPQYGVADLPASGGQLAALYPAKYLREDTFHLLELMDEHLGDYTYRVLTPQADTARKFKYTVLFTISS